MNKFTWMILALALAIAAGLLIKDSDNQPIIIHMINYVRAPKSAEMMSGDIVVDPTAEVATGTEVVIDPTAEAVVDPTAEVVVDPTAEVVVDPTAEVVVEPTAEVVVEPTAEVVVEPTAQ